MKLTLNKLFEYLENDGIFNYLDQYNVPWKNSIDTDILNLDYHTKNGEKVIGPAVKALLTEDGLDTTAKQKLAKLIFYKNQVKWDELWKSQDIYDDFDILDNVNEIRDETTTHEGSDSKTQNIGAKQNTFTEGQQIDSFSKGAQSNTFTKGSQQNSQTKGEETLTEGAQSNTIGTHTDSKTITKSAYNSSTYSPDTQEQDVVGAHTDSYGQKINTNSSRSDSQTEGSREDSSSEGARQDSTTKGQRIDTTSEGAQIITDSGENAYEEIYSVRRHGNIGVTTSGQLIRDFRQTVDFSIFEIVYNDINEILVLNVYGDSTADFEDYTIETNYHLPIASAQKLGGIKVGQNLSIASDGTLNAQAGGGDVTSVNGKTGEVTLDASDVGAASASDMTTAKADIVNIKLDINQLQGSILDLTDRTSTNESDIVNIKLDINQLQGSVLGLHNDLLAVRQVPTGGTEGQVLTKGASGYDWADPSGGGDVDISEERLIYTNNSGFYLTSSNTKYKFNTKAEQKGNNEFVHLDSNGGFYVDDDSEVDIYMYLDLRNGDIGLSWNVRMMGFNDSALSSIYNWISDDYTTPTTGQTPYVKILPKIKLLKNKYYDITFSLSSYNKAPFISASSYDETKGWKFNNYIMFVKRSGGKIITADGNPTGTIINFMGTTAPQGYLACDGSLYNIDDFQDLSNFINTQFGAKNYFGGDGTLTFAVPDLRGEFLRGAGTNSHTNQGNGSTVGSHQDATTHTMAIVDGTNLNHPKGLATTNQGQNIDSTIEGHTSTWGYRNDTQYTDGTNNPSVYTSRPTNTSILYCIKY